MSRRSTVAPLVVPAAALALAAVATGTPKPVASADPTGDSGVAPDITELSIATDGPMLLLRVALANPEALTGEAGLAVALETDGNADNGLEGVDFVLFANATGAAVGKWNGTEFVDAGFEPAAMTFQGGALAVSLRRADLGRPKQVLLFSFSASGDAVDYAPDEAVIAYRVPTVARTNATFTGVPRNGRRFGVATVDVALSDGSTARVATRTCTATLGGKPLGARNACSWSLPKAAKGKTLVVVLRSSLDGEAAPARTFRMKVR